MVWEAARWVTLKWLYWYGPGLQWDYPNNCLLSIDHRLAFFLQPHSTSLLSLSLSFLLFLCFYINWCISKTFLKLFRLLIHIIHCWGKNQGMFSVLFVAPCNMRAGESEWPCWYHHLTPLTCQSVLGSGKRKGSVNCGDWATVDDWLDVKKLTTHTPKHSV